MRVRDKYGRKRKRPTPAVVKSEIVPPTPRRVNCIGPRKAKHTFLSPDPNRVRVCEECRQRQDGYGRIAEPYVCRAPD